MWISLWDDCIYFLWFTFHLIWLHYIKFMKTLLPVVSLKHNARHKSRHTNKTYKQLLLQWINQIKSPFSCYGTPHKWMCWMLRHVMVLFNCRNLICTLYSHIRCHHITFAWICEINQSVPALFYLQRKSTDKVHLSPEQKAALANLHCSDVTTYSFIWDNVGLDVQARWGTRTENKYLIHTMCLASIDRFTFHHLSDKPPSLARVSRYLVRPFSGLILVTWTLHKYVYFVFLHSFCE